MSDSVKFTVTVDTSHTTVQLEVPELDVEHESNLVLDVFPRECVFTAAPYHERISLDAPVNPGKAFPDNIDYEKNIVTFRIPRESASTQSNETTNDPGFRYGFGQQYSGPFALETSQDLRILSNPEQYSISDRMQAMKQAEAKDFHSEHYGMDHIQYRIDKLGLSLDAPLLAPKLSDDQCYRIRVIVEEKQRRTELYTSVEQHGALLLGLIDIILAVCYDRLTNGNELNEANSHINIQRISATLSYFVEFPNTDDVLRSFYRRSCTYPFYRSKDISKACIERFLNSMDMFDKRDWIKHELIYVYDVFKATDCAVLNHCYVKDYIRFVELTIDEDALAHYLSDIKKSLPDVHLQSLGFGEEETVQQLIMEIMGIEQPDSTDSDDTDSQEEETDSSSSASDSCSLEEEENPNENVLEKLMNLKLSC